MRKIVYSILLVSLFFILNLGLYYYSDSYSFFLKKMKYGDDIISNDSKLITDEIFLNNSSSGSCNCDCSGTTQQSEIQKPVENNYNTGSVVSKNQNLIKDYSKEINNILSRFREFYSLNEKKYDEYYKIFDITDEYPDIYSTYLGEILEIYFFTGAKFDDVYNMFELLSGDVSTKNKFSLNKTNNLGKKSFFINLNKSDDFVRIVIDDGSILFGLKIKKSYYNDIKQILQNF